MRLFVGAALLALFVGVAGHSGAATIHVPGDQPTIQAGIDAASVGDTVLVACGTYQERWISMKSGICLRSETGDPACVTIDGDGMGAVVDCDSVDNTAGIEGFTIANAEADYGSGVYCWVSSPVISDCVFEGHLGEFGIGLYCYRSSPEVLRCVFRDNLAVDGAGGGMACIQNSSPTVTECVFTNNIAYEYGGGAVYIANSSSPVFDRCIFAKNWGDFWGGAVLARWDCHPSFLNCTISRNGSGLEGGGVSLLDGSGATLENSIIAFSAYGEAVSCDSTSSATLTCSDLYGNAGGNWVGCIFGQGGTNGNIMADPLFCHPGCFDFHLQAASPCAPFSPPNPECDLIGARGVGCEHEPRVWRVPEDAPGIQAAIDLAGCGDTIIVDSGTYLEHDITLKSSITLRSESGEPECVVIDAENQDRVFRGYGVDNTTTIEGLTLTGGHADGGHWPTDAGGAMYCYACSLRVENCRFTGNSAEGYGGAMACEYSRLTLTGCEFSQNYANSGGALVCRLYTEAQITDCAFLTNTAESFGGAVFCNNTPSPNFTNCLFSGNSAIDGGGFCCHDGATSLFVRCTFAGNTAFLGGGLNTWSSTPSLYNCTFYGNEGSIEAAGIYCEKSDINLANTILSFGISGMAVYCNDFVSPPCSPVLSCCDVYGNAGGDWVGCLAAQAGVSGNFSADPLFCSPDSGDLSLAADSPCLDAPGCHLVGAWGNGCGTWSGIDSEEIPLLGYLELSLPSPNPFNPATEISFAVPQTVEGAKVSLYVCSATGRLVRKLVDEPRAAGRYTVTWDGIDQMGHSVASGVYFCRLTWNDQSETRRMVVVR